MHSTDTRRFEAAYAEFRALFPRRALQTAGKVRHLVGSTGRAPRRAAARRRAPDQKAGRGHAAIVPPRMSRPPHQGRARYRLVPAARRGRHRGLSRRADRGVARPRIESAVLRPRPAGAAERYSHAKRRLRPIPSMRFRPRTAMLADGRPHLHFAAFQRPPGSSIRGADRPSALLVTRLRAGTTCALPARWASGRC